MNEITFNILKIIVTICTALITLYVVPYIYALKEDKKYSSLIATVEMAVRAAEQTIGSGQGSLKKSEVIDFVSKWMDDNGMKITQEQLSQLIEASVFVMNEAKGE